MTPREHREQVEASLLGPRACQAKDSRGRQRPEEECSIRTCFQRDIDRIVYSKSFRRLKHKTQVFLQPEGDHYRTRMTHTLEVNRIARTIARALSLNEDLTEAVALGHDLGHTPFGHAGERLLNSIMPGGFAHYQQSLRVVDRLEKEGEGLNLTWEVRNGIVCHTKGQQAATLEGQVVRLADQIAYINHDIEDALRGGIIYPMDIPLAISKILGFTHGERINALVEDVITASRDQDAICQSPGGWERPWPPCGSSCSRASTPTPWPRARKEKPRRCSGGCSSTTRKTRTSSPPTFRRSAWRRAWTGPCATTSPA